MTSFFMRSRKQNEVLDREKPGRAGLSKCGLFDVVYLGKETANVAWWHGIMLNIRIVGAFVAA